MDKPFSIGEILLELMCVAIMLLAFVSGMEQLNSATSITQRDMQNVQYQREYASLARYDGSAIAYTEVLDCIFKYASRDFPIIVTNTANCPTTPVFSGVNYSLPLPQNIRANPSASPLVSVGHSFRGPVSEDSTGPQNYADLAEWLLTVTSPATRVDYMLFRGKVLKTSSGIPYGIVFAWGYTGSAGCA